MQNVRINVNLIIGYRIHIKLMQNTTQRLQVFFMAGVIQFETGNLC